MRIPNRKLQYLIANQSRLVQKRICNVSRVSFIVENHELYLLYIFNHMCFRSYRLHSAAEKLKKVGNKTSSIFKWRAC